MNMKRFLLSILCCLLAVVSGYAQGSDDFGTYFKKTNSGYAEGTTTAGWKYTYAAIVSIDNTFAPTINGKTSAKGTITSPTLAGGCDTLSLKYAYTFSESKGVSFKVTIKQGGADVASYDVVNTTAEQNTVYEWKQDVDVQGDFVIYITNNSPSNSTSNKDRFSIWNIKWTAYGQASVPQLDAPVISPESCTFDTETFDVTISAEDGADIYYTLDGSEPQAGTNKYTAPFTITGTTTVKAIAVNSVGASDVATATYTRVAASPTITPDGNGEFEGSLVVTIEPAAGTTAYYTLNGNAPDRNSDVCPETLTLKADATLKVIAYEGELASPLYTKEFTLKESASSGSGSSSNTATLVEDVADLKVGDKVVIVASGYDYALSTTQNNNNRGQVAITKNGNNVTLEEGVQILTLEEGTTSGSFAFYTGSGYLYAASSSANHLKTQATNNANGSWSISIVGGVASIQANGSYTRNVMRYNQTSDLFSCYAEDNSQCDVSLYKVNAATVEPYVLNVSVAGWATLFLDYNAEIPEDVTCYVISKFEGDKATLTEVTGVLPKETGVIVKANPGNYTFEATGETADVESNLSGSVKNEYVVKEAYVLSIVEGEVGLYKAQMAGGVFLNNANKAYLPASALTASAQGASGFKFRFDNQTTGIEGAPALNTAKAIYDLSGRKVNNATAPGLYIINGKKVMVK